MMHKIKVLSFDLDDTLWPNTPTILRAEKLLYQWLADNIPVITRRYDLPQLRDKRLAVLNEFPELAHNLTKLRIRSFEQLVDEFNLSNDWIEPAFDTFYEARQRVTLFEDVKPVLDELSKKFLMVSLTNGNADTVKTGVDHWFDFSLSSEKTGQMKSEPGIYEQVQKLTNIDAHQMLHIGDDPVHDVVGAQSAGVYAIWLNRDHKEWSLEGCEPDATITDLYELTTLLAEKGR